MSRREKLTRGLLRVGVFFGCWFVGFFFFFFSLPGANCSRESPQLCPSVPGPGLQQWLCPVPHEPEVSHAAVTRCCPTLIQREQPRDQQPCIPGWSGSRSKHLHSKIRNQNTKSGPMSFSRVVSASRECTSAL